MGSSTTSEHWAYYNYKKDINFIDYYIIFCVIENKNNLNFIERIYLETLESHMHQNQNKYHRYSNRQFLDNLPLNSNISFILDS